MQTERVFIRVKNQKGKTSKIVLSYGCMRKVVRAREKRLSFLKVSQVRLSFLDDSTALQTSQLHT